MSDMVERVARAIGEAIYGHCNMEDTPFTWGVSTGAAYKAIEAMREPTEAMENSGRIVIPGGPEFLSGKVWQAMIDAALKNS